MPDVLVVAQGGEARIFSSYDPNRVRLIKLVPGRRWSKTEKHWTIPSAGVDILVAKLKRAGIGCVVNRDVVQRDRCQTTESRRDRARSQAAATRSLVVLHKMLQHADIAGSFEHLRPAVVVDSHDGRDVPTAQWTGLQHDARSRRPTMMATDLAVPASATP